MQCVFVFVLEKKNTLESSDDETDIEMKRQYEKAKVSIYCNIAQKKYFLTNI